MAISLDDVEKTSRFNTYSSRVIEKLDQFELYSHQRDALLRLKAWYNNEKFRIGLVVIPTGGGKSGVAVLAPYVLNTTRVLVITPSLQITNQLAAAFGREPTKSFYVKHGIVAENAANHFVEASRLINQGREIGDLAENLVIVNAQKFASHSSIDWEKLDRKSFNLLIVDEAHHFPAPTWNNIVCQAILSAQDGYICYQISLNELIANGVIRKADFRQIGNDHDKATEQRTLLSTEILRILNEHDQIDPTVQHQAMVLTTDINDANRFAKSLNTTAKRDIAAPYTGDTKNSDAILRQFEKENGTMRVLVVCGKLIEGYDRKQVSVCAIVRNVGSKSKVLFTQFVGRCLRKVRSDDPIEAVILSHVAYNQKQNYDNLNEVAEDDPDEDDDNVQ